MKLILGLGNPGKEYETTRHNVGFLALDELAERNDFTPFALDAKLKAMVSKGTIDEVSVLLVKPTTFMNLSGESLCLIKQFYKVDDANILIVYDDKDMEFGKIRFRSSGSSGGHNGIKSIIQTFGSENFDRLKIGVGDLNHPAYKKDASTFVLGKFSPQEMEKLKDIILFDACKRTEEWCVGIEA